ELARVHPAASALQLVSQITGSGIRFPERVLLIVTSGQILVHFRAVPQVERDRAIHLLERQRGKSRTDRFGGLAVLKLSYDARDRDAALYEVKAVIAAFHESSMLH